MTNATILRELSFEESLERIYERISDARKLAGLGLKHVPAARETLLATEVHLMNLRHRADSDLRNAQIRRAFEDCARARQRVSQVAFGV